MYSVDIETYKKYDGTKKCEQAIIKDTLEPERKEWFKKNKKKGYYYPVLNSQEFVLGAIYDEKGNIEFFRSPIKLWDRLKEIIQTNMKRGKRSWIYAHNLSYDWNGFARGHYFDKDIKIVSFDPFLATVFKDSKKKEGENYGWFVDTM